MKGKNIFGDCNFQKEYFKEILGMREIYYGVFSGRTQGGEREVPRWLRQEEEW